MRPDLPEPAAWIEIDDDAIRHNVSCLAEWLSPTSIMAVVKANGYGHGIETAAQAALEGGAHSLGVARLDEALALREAGFTAKILILGCGLPDQADAVVASDLSQTVSDEKMIRALDAAGRSHGRTVHVHLKVDTGMGRVGIHPDEVDRFLGLVASLSGLRLEGFATHVGWDDPTLVERQIEAFVELACRSPLPDGCELHAANSLVAASCARGRLSTARLGLSLYGVVPLTHEVSYPARRLRPALSLRAKITQLRDLAPGQTISYGGTFTIDRPTRAALIPVGYGDGYPRALSNRASVLVAGRRCLVLGSVCMDQMVVDVTHVPSARVGSIATLLGPDGDDTVSASELADLAETISYEILSALGPRLPRVAAPTNS